ncbi:hypothetical protein QQ045_029756 [Rhodiola kirilowii]
MTLGDPTLMYCCSWCKKKVSHKMHPTETKSEDDFMPETLCGKDRGKAKKLSAPETESSDYSDK